MLDNWEMLTLMEGIDVEYNNKTYAFEVMGERKEYAVGEILCELTRFDAFSLKEILIRVPDSHALPNRKRMLEAVGWLRDEMRKVYLPVVSEMASIEFLNCVHDYYKDESEEYMVECIGNLEAVYSFDDFGEFYHLGEVYNHAFMDSGFDGAGAQSVGQLLLTMYLEVILVYMMVRHVLDLIVNEGNSDEGRARANQIITLSDKYSHLQEIEYRVLFYNKQFNSVYTIKTMASLCLLELAHIYESNTPIVKCKNCGHYFVPQKRSDTKYCNYPAPDNPDRTCKEIGAQNTWANKEKTDDVTRAYRTVYMRNKMRANRHPDDEGAQKRLAQLTEGIRDWRHRLASGEAENDEFIKWLEEF